MNNESNSKKRYKEILRLEKMLTESEIPHICDEFMDGWKVVFPGNGNAKVMEALEYTGSYSHVGDRLECMVLIESEDEDKNGAVGYLLAEDVYFRIKKYWDENYRLNRQIVSYLRKKCSPLKKFCNEEFIEKKLKEVEIKKISFNNIVELFCSKCLYCGSPGLGYCIICKNKNVNLDYLCEECKNHSNFEPFSYCPYCGSPITTEAKKEIEEKLEACIDKKVFSQRDKDLISLIMLATTKGNNYNDRI